MKTHLLRAFGKLGVSGRTAAVTAAIEPGTTFHRPAGEQAVRDRYIPTDYWFRPLLTV